MDDRTRTLLKTISSKPYEECEKEWREVLGLLRLKVIYVSAVQTILKEGRWRNKPNPLAYIRKGSIWCAIRIGLVDVPWRDERMVLAADLNYTDTDGNPVPHDEKLDLALGNYEERVGPYYDDGDYDVSPSDRVSGSLLNDADELNWERAAELAGLDAGERIVLDIQLMGLGREKALSLCYTDEDRKFLQAAWKRFMRHREALRETLLSGGPHQSRRINRPIQEKKLELVFIELANGSLRISFRELVPEDPPERI
jgi:hypothetical protein